MREIGWKYNFLSSIVELSPNECPFDNSLKVYRAIVRNLQLPIKEELLTEGFSFIEPVTGLTEILRSIIDDKLQEIGEQKVLTWLRTTIKRAHCESITFKRAIVRFCQAYIEKEEEVEDLIEAWLMGENLPIQKLKEVGINEVIDKGNAFIMLRSLTQLALALGFGGTIIMFDEVDRNLSLSAKRKQILGDNLRQIIDHCGQHSFRSTFVLYAVPPEFLREVVPDYPALAQRLLPPIPQSKRSPNSVIIDLEALDIPPYELLMKIGEKLTKVYSVAYDIKFEPNILSRLLNAVISSILNSTFEINHRRLFVRTWIQVLHQLRDGEKDTEISIEEIINALIKDLDMNFEEQ